MKAAEWASRARRDIYAKFAPPPNISVSEWADRYRVLSPEASAEHGRWRTDRAPYLRGIMDAVSDPLVENVIVMSCAQVGKTEFELNVLGYLASLDPCPIMVMLPTEHTAMAWSRDRLAPMFRDSPKLQGLFNNSSSRSADNTILWKRVPGGSISLVGANAPSGLAMRPARVVLADEVDRYPVSAGNEGDPIALIEKRTATYWNRLLVKVSTPSVKGVSRIEMEWETSDQRRFFVACPHCGERQHLEWRNVQWDKGTDGKHQPETTRYHCARCGAGIEEHHKLAMLQGGEWRAERPEIKKAGFHLNALYSPWTPWADVVREFLAAKNKPELLQVWTNTMLGEPYEQSGDAPAWVSLQNRADAYAAGVVPDGGLLMTAGVDVQRNRLAVLVEAWGPNEECWVVWWGEIFGDPKTEGPWRELDYLLEKQWPRASGGTLNIASVAVDASDGGTMQDVYNYVRRRPRAIAVKGMSTAGKPVLGRPTRQDITWRGRKTERGVDLWPVGTDTAKQTIYARLEIDSPDDGRAMIHFPQLGEDFFQQLTAEQLVTKYRRGVPSKEWFLPSGRRNEALDCKVYSYAAAIRAGVSRMDWGALRQAYTPEAQGAQSAPTKKPARRAPRKGSMFR